MYLTEPMRDGNSVVLMQAWHWFENKWHYQSEEFIFFYRSTALGFIADMTTQTATDWVNEYRFTK